VSAPESIDDAGHPTRDPLPSSTNSALLSARNIPISACDSRDLIICKLQRQQERRRYITDIFLLEDSSSVGFASSKNLLKTLNVHRSRYTRGKRVTRLSVSIICSLATNFGRVSININTYAMYSWCT